MTSFIWPLSKLEDLLNHSEANLPEWAAARLFYLYPERFRELLPGLLADRRQVVVETCLNFVGIQSREDLIPILKELYLTGGEDVSAKAIHVLGDWRIAEAVDWVRERILSDPPLAKKQIIAMIYTLGRIHKEEAYYLLKDTEAAVQEKDSSHWHLFYASLLEHRRVEDLGTLLTVILDEKRKEEYRRDALGLLLAQVDPVMNPSDVFFVNKPALMRHVEARAANLEAAAAPDDPNSIQPLKALIRLLEGDVSQIVDALKELNHDSTDRVESCDFENAILSESLRMLNEDPGTTNWHYGLSCLALSAMMRMAEQRIFPKPHRQAGKEEKLGFLLENRLPDVIDEVFEADVVAESERQELVSYLEDYLGSHQATWGTLRCLNMLGSLRAGEAAVAVVELLKDLTDEFSAETAKTALLNMGMDAVPPLLARLDRAQLAERYLILEILAQLPTEESVQAISRRFPSLYGENPEGSLRLAYDMGAKDFLPFLQEEYRTGEWNIGRVYVHLCRVNQLSLPRLAEIERDVQRGDAFTEESRRIWTDQQAHWPAAIQLELACKRCGKKYQYEVQDFHQHFHKNEERDGAEQDFTPYKQGIVIVDDLRCKNCKALNRFELTPATFAQITTESMKLVAFQRMNMQPPSYYPFKQVQLDEKDGKPLSLLDVEQEHLQAIRLQPSKPSVHLACGKFYEYVKEYASARKFYLKAIDLDARALEALAGLARLDHAEGKTKEASDWIQSCYDNLEKGNFYLTEDIPVFKKMVRQKRREFARELGIKPEERPVEIRFRFDATDHPKNKPCPCGSGKKYKLCCMK
ncbi:MAG: SEC-C metal-binding domain-containing protein [Desulfoferrobacter sp.]